jgi:L-iditol 2-dehydrogenase
MGAVQAIVCDRDAERLSRAAEFGATETVRADGADPVAFIRGWTAGEGVDVAFEAAGSPQSHRQCVECATRGGTVVFVGWLAEGELALDLHAIGTKELTVRGMFRYRNVFPEALALVERGMVQPRRLVSGRFPLANVVQALEEAMARRPGTLKIMIEA